MQQDASEHESASTLALPPGQGAPAPNELTSSADEADPDDEEDGAAALEVVAGGWAVLHGLSGRRSLNGLLARVCGRDPPAWWADATTLGAAAADRMYVQIVPDSLVPGVHATGRLSVRLANLHATTLKDAIGRLVHAWIESGPSSPTFAVPAWEALADERFEQHRVNERAQVHNMCLHACENNGIDVEKVVLFDPANPRGPSRRVVLKLKTAPPVAVDGGSGAGGSGSGSGSGSGGGGAAVPPDEADASSDLRQMRFVELCSLLEALEAVDGSRKGFNERKLQQLSAFWRGGGGGGSPAAPPRHLRQNLFDVMRLLLPHNDARRYFWGTAGLAKAVGRAMLQDSHMAKKVDSPSRGQARLAVARPRLAGFDDPHVSRTPGSWLTRGSTAACGPSACHATSRSCSLRNGAVAPSCVRVRRALQWVKSTRCSTGSTARTRTAGTARRSDWAVSSRGRPPLSRSSGSCASCSATYSSGSVRRCRWRTRASTTARVRAPRSALASLTAGRRSRPYRGRWPKLVMDSLCRAQGRVGTPSNGNPPLMYSCFRHQHSLWAVCVKAEANELPKTYPPPTSLGVHVRAQGSIPCTDTADGAVLDRS